ncbi:MAG: Na/Pi symporter, partial [Bacteroidota bacterium]
MAINDLLGGQEKMKRSAWVNGVAIVFSVFLFMFSIRMMGSAIASLGGGFADYAIHATENPFIGLFIGLLSTAILQSSSTTTTIAVAAVASGSLTLHGAIPIIMGANIGTTLTSTIVAMGYITKPVEFRKAIAAGTAHDFFNILMVVLLFPLEMKYRFLERLSGYLTSGFNVVSVSERPVIELGLNGLLGSINEWFINSFGALITLGLAILILFYCLKSISKLLYHLLIGRINIRFKTAEGEWRNMQLFALADFEEIKLNKLTHEVGDWPPPVGTILIERSAYNPSLGFEDIDFGDSLVVEPPNGKEGALTVVGTAHDLNQFPPQFSQTPYGYISFDTLELLGEEKRF